MRLGINRNKNMRYSHFLGKSTAEISRTYDSINHELLTRAGYIDQVASGIFTLLPLGKRVVSRIETIIREEMDAIGGQEILMPSLHPKALWDKTDRWDTVDVFFKTKSRHGQEYGLSPTHEEIVTPLAKKYVSSYRDLPLYLYHISQKFRDEPRPKSGILRGREFGMKDLYSFHVNHEDFASFYATVTKAYLTIFARCGLTDVKITEASGGAFTKKYSHEFNILTPAGEVDLVYCDSCHFAQNSEIVKKKQGDCMRCGEGKLQEGGAIEVGNIFDLGTRFSDAFGLFYRDQKGEQKQVFMGCYGIGTTRLMGTIAEIFHDAQGLKWPTQVTPFHCHLIDLGRETTSYAALVERTLIASSISVLFDDRERVRGGEKLATADLIGIPVRLVVSDRTKKNVEVKIRGEKKERLMSPSEVVSFIHDFYENDRHTHSS